MLQIIWRLIKLIGMHELIKVIGRDAYSSVNDYQHYRRACCLHLGIEVN
jgi:hypothetical protein